MGKLCGFSKNVLFQVNLVYLSNFSPFRSLKIEGDGLFRTKKFRTKIVRREISHESVSIKDLWIGHIVATDDN